MSKKFNIDYLKKIKDEFEKDYSTNLQDGTKKHVVAGQEISIPKINEPERNYAKKFYNQINDFEDESWKPNSVGLKSGFDSIDDAFDGGLKPGFYVLGGDSNIGKSGLASQISIQTAKSNNDVFVFDFSLDDPLPDKIPRLIGSTHQVMLNAVKAPLQYSEYPGMLVRRMQGLNDLRELTTRYNAFDSSEGNYIETILKTINDKLEEFEIEGEEKRLAIFIDSFHDLDTHESYSSQKQKYTIIADWCADLAINYNAVVFVTAELTKLYDNRRPYPDDIREAVKIKYQAKAILMAYNEVHYKGQDSEVFYLREDENDLQKYPVFEVNFAKNKISSYKGKKFFYFYPEMAYFQEVSKEEEKIFMQSLSTG